MSALIASHLLLNHRAAFVELHAATAGRQVAFVVPVVNDREVKRKMSAMIAHVPP